jgi:hypothetical protein
MKTMDRKNATQVWFNAFAYCVLLLCPTCSFAEAAWQRVSFPLPAMINSVSNVETTDILMVVNFNSANDTADDAAEVSFVKSQLTFLKNGDINSFGENTNTGSISSDGFEFLRGMYSGDEVDGVKKRYRWGGIDYTIVNVSNKPGRTNAFFVARYNNGAFRTCFNYMLNPLITNLCMVANSNTSPGKVPWMGKFKVSFESPVASPRQGFWSAFGNSDDVEIIFNGQVVERKRKNGNGRGRHEDYGNIDEWEHKKDGPYRDVLEYFEQQNRDDVAKFILDAGVLKIVFFESRAFKGMLRDIYKQEGRGYVRVNDTFRGPLEDLLDTEEFRRAISKLSK